MIDVTGYVGSTRGLCEWIRVALGLDGPGAGEKGVKKAEEADNICMEVIDAV